MSRRKKGQRVLGPYKKRGGWRIAVVDAGGKKTFKSYGTEQEARQVVRSLTKLMDGDAALAIEDCIGRYEKYLLNVKGNKQRSVDTTIARLKSFFPERDALMSRLGKSECQRYYDALCRSVEVDTHRNSLAEVKTFLKWCSQPKQGWLRSNPLLEVEGVGKRKRGKEQLRVDESRMWLSEALKGADEGEVGAVAALCTLLLGVRATPIVTRTVRDLDDGGRLLHITNAKTEAGNRTVVVPELLRPYLLKLAEGKEQGDLLFGHHLYGWVRAWVKRICLRAGVPAITAHGMRGTHASLATEVGATGHEVARALGHESERTTHAHYTKKATVQAATQKRALTVLEGGLA
jgi:integrase